MWIKSIELTNFKSYKKAQFDFLEPEVGKNLVVIGAENGHGKTTLLEALYLGLYDADAMPYLSRAGVDSNQNKSYPDYIARALHQSADSKHRRYHMQIVIEIVSRNAQGTLSGIKVKRTWHFDESKAFLKDDNECLVYELDGSFASSGLPLDDEEAAVCLATRAMPMDYAPFFFFDGEKIVSQAKKLGAGAWLIGALRGLTGITLLEELQEDLRAYCTSYVSESKADDKKRKFDELGNKRLALKSELNAFNAHLGLVEEQYNKAVERQSELLVQLGGERNGQSIQSVQELIEQSNKIGQQLDTYKKDIKNSIVALPLSLLSKDEIDELLDTLAQEKNRLSHEAGKEQTSGRLEEFWQSFVESEKVKEVLGRSASGILNDDLMKQAVAECWEGLFYPLPDNCADSIRHNYLSTNAHSHIENEASDLPILGNTALDDVLKQMDDADRELSTVQGRIKELQSTGADTKVDELQAVSSDIQNNLGPAKTTAANKVNAQKQVIEQLNQEIQKLEDEISDSNPKLKKSARAKQVQTMIDVLTKQLIDQKRELVATLATDINRAISHDDRVHRIGIDGDNALTLYSHNGDKIDIGSSAGQVQVLIMSLILALATATDYETPFVIDTPLARLDTKHRKRLIDHLAGLKQQVILLSQDAEITSDILKELAPHLSQSYLVTAESLDTGGMSSQVKKDAYF